MKLIFLYVIALTLSIFFIPTVYATSPYFEEAKKICSFTEGIGEDECIETRMRELANVDRISKLPYFDQAMTICSFTGRIRLDSCIINRNKELLRLEKMGNSRFFSTALSDCSFTNWIGTDRCVQRRIRELEKIEHLAKFGPSLKRKPISKSKLHNTVCCKICDTGQACGNSCIAWSKQCHQHSGCAC